jgi:hypothetical protein
VLKKCITVRLKKRELLRFVADGSDYVILYFGNTKDEYLTPKNLPCSFDGLAAPFAVPK